VIAEARPLVSMIVAEQQFGVRIDAVRESLCLQQLAKVPLSAPEIADVLNLRGRIVTAIDLGHRLGIQPGTARSTDQAMNLEVDHRGELYRLLVDRVGEVLALSEDRFEADSSSLPPHWRSLAHGIFRLDDAPLVELDVQRVLALASAS
jgi:purine-binding chemotaxis protein CheW